MSSRDGLSYPFPRCYLARKGLRVMTSQALNPASAPESERVLILDFGSQYGKLIARRVREQNVFCQIVRHDLSAERIAELKPHGLILSGGPASVYAPAAPAR